MQSKQQAGYRNDGLRTVSIARSLALVFAAILVVPSARADPPQESLDSKWRNVGPWGGMVAALAIPLSAPRNLYAGTWDGGVYRSQDRGGAWRAARHGMPKELSVNSIVIDPSDERIVYAGTMNVSDRRFTGVFKSTDRGSSWQAVNQGIDPSVGDIWAMGATQWGGGAILAGGVYGIYRTTDRGGGWDKAEVIGYVDPWVREFATDPRHPRVVYAGCTEGILKSSDGGASWAPASSGTWGTYPIGVVAIAVSPKVSATLYATSANGPPSRLGLWRSTDSGNTWTLIRNSNTEGEYLSIAVDPSNPDILYVGVDWEGILKTEDGGATWQLMKTGLPEFEFDPLYMDLEVDPVSSSTVYAATSMGVYRSDDAGVTWSEADRGLGAFGVHQVALDQSDSALMYAVTDEYTVVRSADAGKTWEQVYPFQSAFGQQDIVTPLVIATGTDARGAVYFASIGDMGAVSVFSSTDAGESWKRNYAPGRFGSRPTFIVPDPVRPETLYLGLEAQGLGPREAQHGVFRSDDGGAHWRRMAKLPNHEVFPACMTMHPANSRILFVGGYGGVYGTRDGGATWSDLSPGMPEDPSVTALVIDRSDPRTLYAGTEVEGVLRSTDAGRTWTAVNVGLPARNITGLAIDPSDTSVLYAATWWSGLFKTQDSGQTWKAINDGIFSWMPRSIAIDPTDPQRVYVGCWGSGIYMTTTGGQ